MISVFLENPLLIVFPIIMIATVLSDYTRLIIPNEYSIALACAFLAYAGYSVSDFSTLGDHLLAGVIVFGVGVVLFALGLMGGGDVKIASAAALWLGTPLLLDFVLITSIVGAVITLFILFMERSPALAPLTPGGWVESEERDKLRVPYGVAISAAALIVFFQSL